MKEVTVVITSCDRIELLQETIKSFEDFNTYPIKEFIIIEDSGKKHVYQKIFELYGDRFKIIFNNPQLKQIASIDRAYREVQTEYIFHCEDDWQFYRSGFIEDSLVILENLEQVKQVGLRSIQHDMIPNHPTIIYDKKAKSISGINFYQARMKDSFMQHDWVTCSFNPGLLRKKDYDLIGSYQSKAKSEAGISMWYKNRNYTNVTLENDAVKHLGWESSTMDHYKQNYSFNVRCKNLLKAFLNLLGTNYDYNKG